ncbi:MAG: amidohydrolase family protein, partial [Anaerolineaceae bacterium]|nr:amidohydrolase family protein [Anaerolineaceae bacterium]
MPMNSAERIALVKTALGKEPFDTIISDVQVVNVYSNEIIPGAIGIKYGRVVSFRVKENAPAQERFSARGMYALPGFIDTHVHIDSTLLTPEGLVELIAPHGTTALFADPMEIANVAGLEGLKALFVGTQRIPCHVYLEIPSRVPTAPGLETTGGELDLDDVRELLQWKQTISLGELDPSKILGLRSEYFEKIEAAQKIGKIANGHAIGLSGADLEAYACGGLSDDHECVTFEEAKNRIELGLAVLIREGSTERNLDALVQGIIREKADTHNWMMCTDDKHPNEILREGHINYMVNKSIALGLEPIRAIQ